MTVSTNPSMTGEGPELASPGPIGGTTPSTGAFTSLTLTAGGNAILTSDAANILAQRNGTAAQTYRLYNTFTDASNGEWLESSWASNEVTIATKANGTGSQRSMTFSAAIAFVYKLSGTSKFVLDASSIRPDSVGLIDNGQAGAGWRRLYIDYTDTATVGAVTINKAAGRVRIAAAGTSVVVTNSLVTAASKIFCTISINDGTALLKNVVPVAGSFTITLNAAATAETTIDFFVVSAD